VIAILLIILVIFLGWTFFWLLYSQQQSLLEGRRLGMKDQVSLALSICRDMENRAANGDIARDYAKDYALDLISQLRYGEEGAGYFYVVNDNAIVLAHPLRSDLVGQNLSGFTDSRGQPFVAEMVDRGRRERTGFLTHHGQWVGESAETSRKLAYFRFFEPWGYLIITELSTADISAAIMRELYSQLWIVLLLSASLALVLTETVRRMVLSGVDRLLEMARKLSAGDLSARAPVSPTDEVRPVLVAINQMADTIQARDQQILMTQRAAMFALAKLAEARDNETGGHLLRVREYAVILAQGLRRHPSMNGRITDEFISDLHDAVMLHDIGKVAIPDHILRKPDVLDEGEMAIMMSHTLVGANTLRAARRRMNVDSSFLRMAERIARSHHERWDGKGYVEQLKGEDIPLEARIFSVVDVYDALTTERPYKRRYSHEEALATIRMDYGKHFDPTVLDVFFILRDEFNQIRAQLADE
jgi:response regulator RpfG family c-di-GMP phosphodiesterase